LLPANTWRPWEPRFGFPVFRDMTSRVSFSIRPDFAPVSWKSFPIIVKTALRQGWKPTLDLLREHLSLLFSGAGRNLSFRLVVTSRGGNYLATHRVPGRFPPGGSIDLNVTEIIKGMGLPTDEYMAILIMSRGRADGFRSSPGSYSMTNCDDRRYTTYRTGGFARSLNDPRRKRHSGFRGINPKAVANERSMSSLLLINHSSWPQYDQTVTPRSVLLRADGATREADFGPIRPFEGVERSLADLFGNDVADFLAPSAGRGTVITTCAGVTLASIHLMRSRDGTSMSIEHSRPSHTYLLNGAG
jgi:hypothetical protein